ncbi:MAG TPA: AAA-like domain-containing protein [Nostocaceae cyanobacterium]|nr:AAA-like domain-containing protein [Kamptonema sp.]HLO87629.1 AAA-like domain-containing protein [Nostocaceae cyanobacterium]
MNQKDFDNIYKRLSFRLKEVLIPSLQGKADEEIAEDLHIQRATVRKHLQAIRLKFGIANKDGDRYPLRQELIKWFGKYKPELVNPELLNKINGKYPDVELDFPDGSLPLDSPFYVNRSPHEYDCYKEILKPGSLIRIKGPKQIGKTSLMTRILAHAATHGCRTVPLNLWEDAEKGVFISLDKFLRWLCANVSLKLGIKPMLNDYWDEDIGSKVSATRYFQVHLLEQLNSPLVLALDEVDRVFWYPHIAEDFFPLLRDWYEEANNLEIWQQLRLVVTYSTEPFIPLDIHQSPFNVGLPVKLPEFTDKQVQNLAKLHQLPWTNGEGIKQLMAMVGGHPFLVRLALYHLGRQDTTLDHLLSEAATQAGIYSNHLRRLWELLQKQPELVAAMKKVVTADTSVKLEPTQTYKLEGMGLVKVLGDEVTPSCQLYSRYFRNRL